MNWYQQAEEKLAAGLKEVSGSKERAMKTAVQEALLSFCRQEEEFAQAVVQGGSFKDCMAAVAKDVGSSLSDLEAYKRAAAFYFPGAHIEFAMTIDLVGEAGRGEDAAQADKSGIVLNLADFL